MGIPFRNGLILGITIIWPETKCETRSSFQRNRRAPHEPHEPSKKNPTGLLFKISMSGSFIYHYQIHIYKYIDIQIYIVIFPFPLISANLFRWFPWGCDLWVGYRIARGLAGQTRSWWGAFLFFGMADECWSWWWGYEFLSILSRLSFFFWGGGRGVGLYGCQSISLPVLWFLFLGMSLDRSWPDPGIWVLGSQI